MVKVRKSNHMHGWRRIPHESRFYHFIYSQANSKPNTETYLRLKEILLLVVLFGCSCTLAPFVIPVMYDFAALHTTLI